MNREKKEGYRRTSRRKEQQDEEHKLVPEDPCRSPNGRQQCPKIKDWMLDKLKLESIGLNSRWHARIKRKESKTFTQAIPEHFGEMGKETDREEEKRNKQIQFVFKKWKRTSTKEEIAESHLAVPVNYNGKTNRATDSQCKGWLLFSSLLSQPRMWESPLTKNDDDQWSIMLTSFHMPFRFCFFAPPPKGFL